MTSTTETSADDSTGLEGFDVAPLPPLAPRTFTWDKPSSRRPLIIRSPDDTAELLGPHTWLALCVDLAGDDEPCHIKLAASTRFRRVFKAYADQKKLDMSKLEFYLETDVGPVRLQPETMLLDFHLEPVLRKEDLIKVKCVKVGSTK